jgi:AraC-like DNA-binding protein
MSISFSDLLLVAHLRSADCAIVDFGADGSIWVPLSRMVTFHYVLQGTVSIRLATPGRALTELNAGDFAMLVTGSSHYLTVDANAHSQRFDYFKELHGLEEPPTLCVGRASGARVLSGVFGGSQIVTEEISPLPELVIDRAEQGANGAIFPFFSAAARFEQACHGIGARAFICSVAHGFFIKLIRRQRSMSSTSAPDAVTIRAPRITLALRLIDAAPEIEWTVSSLAKEVGASRSMFAKQFLTLVGRPPFRYLTDVRMRRATELLADTSHSIAHVAAEVGYQSATSFARTFRRERGVTPRQFRTDSAGDRSIGRRLPDFVNERELSTCSN